MPVRMRALPLPMPHHVGKPAPLGIPAGLIRRGAGSQPVRMIEDEPPQAAVLRQARRRELSIGGSPCLQLWTHSMKKLPSFASAVSKVSEAVLKLMTTHQSKGPPTAPSSAPCGPASSTADDATAFASPTPPDSEMAEARYCARPALAAT